jgi:Transposase
VLYVRCSRTLSAPRANLMPSTRRTEVWKASRSSETGQLIPDACGFQRRRTADLRCSCAPGRHRWARELAGIAVGGTEAHLDERTPQRHHWLLNAPHLRNVPGRKTDMADAAWIARLVAHGLVRPSFVPPKPIRELRDLTRYRKAQIQERTREAQRLDKILQDAGIKLSSVASDVRGRSRRAMLAALVVG